MKKAVVVFMAVVFTVSVLNGQSKNSDKEHANANKKEVRKERIPLRKLEGTKVSQASKENFTTIYGKVSDVKWTRTTNFDEALVTKDGSTFTAFFDSDGKLVGTVQESSFSKLPAKGQEEIKTKYKDYTIGKVIFYDDNEYNETDMLLYGLQFDDMDNYFVEMEKGTKNIVVRVDATGFTEFFTSM